MTEHEDTQQEAQKRGARRTAIILALLAVGVYFAFIVATGLKS